MDGGQLSRKEVLIHYMSNPEIKLDLRTVGINKIAPNEKFIQIDSFPDYYISNYGRCFSNKTNKLLKAQKSKTGYYMFRLYDENQKWQDAYIHRLVAEHYCKNNNPYLKTEVHHKNKVKNDNRYANLLWISRDEHRLLDSQKELFLFDDTTGEFRQYKSIGSLARKLKTSASKLSNLFQKESFESYNGYTTYELECNDNVYYIAYTEPQS